MLRAAASLTVYCTQQTQGKWPVRTGIGWAQPALDGCCTCIPFQFVCVPFQSVCVPFQSILGPHRDYVPIVKVVPIRTETVRKWTETVRKSCVRAIFPVIIANACHTRTHARTYTHAHTSPPPHNSHPLTPHSTPPAPPPPFPPSPSPTSAGILRSVLIRMRSEEVPLNMGMRSVRIQDPNNRLVSQITLRSPNTGMRSVRLGRKH